MYLAAQEKDRPAAVTARWYRSNASGMALEPVSSRLVALRGEYCLSIEGAGAAQVPAFLLPYCDASFTIELRRLYENGKEIRRQWIFRDSRNVTRLDASGTGSFFSGESSGEEKKAGFIELRDESGSITRELSFEADRFEWDFRFSYNGNILTRVENWFKAPPPEGASPAGESGSGFVLLFVDSYRYTRPLSLRAIDRTLYDAAGEKLSRVSFPRIGTAVPPGEELSTPGTVSTSEFLLDAYSPESSQINYTLDNRGRILTEVWRDKDGVAVGELVNTWAGDRLQSVLWKSGDDERRVEYEYDSSGNRIAERDFRHGVLERSVTSRD
ncbi:MAG: hypothetical protein FWC45_06410, partial [Treponema sp.]|nr:hypothetical protein [Treponema sp.]